MLKHKTSQVAIQNTTSAVSNPVKHVVFKNRFLLFKVIGYGNHERLFTVKTGTFQSPHQVERDRHFLNKIQCGEIMT
jgi:hypothetical protein